MQKLTKAASFAKSFTDPDDYDPDEYVASVNRMIVLAKMQGSRVCKRAITSDQLEELTIHHALELLYKWWDFAIAESIIDTLNLTDHIPNLYQRWIETTLKYSVLPENQIKIRIENQLSELQKNLKQNAPLGIEILSLVEMARDRKFNQQSPKDLDSCIDILLKYEKEPKNQRNLVKWLLNNKLVDKTLVFLNNKSVGDPDMYEAIFRNLLDIEKPKLQSLEQINKIMKVRIRFVDAQKLKNLDARI